MTNFKAIETRYKGYRFRSRLEARWAVFFDALGLTWEYEPEGFETDAGWYLPDFRVLTPQGEPIWYEIKPKHITTDSKFNAFSISLENRHGVHGYENEPYPRAMLLKGDPVDIFQDDKHYICPRCGYICENGVNGIFTSVGPSDFGGTTIFHDCDACDHETPAGGGNALEKGPLCSTEPSHGSLLVNASVAYIMLMSVRARAVTARSARFEHGETP